MLVAKRSLLSGALGLLLASGGFPAAPAQAAYPGANGKLVLEIYSYFCDCWALFTVNADRSRPRQLTRLGGEFPAWSPDGTKVAFAGSGISVINEDGTGEIALTDSYEDLDPTWSPDGSRIAFARDYDLWVMNSDGSGLAQLTFSTSVGERDPAWSPDGTKLAFTGYGENTDIYVMNADGTGLRRLTDNPEYDWKPNWSPDGTKIAFASEHHNNFDIWVMNADGRDRIDLSQGTEFEDDPAWSPDGARIAFQRGIDIWLMNADGSKQRNFTHQLLGRGESGSQPDWQPACTITGTRDADVITGTAGRDVICGLGGDDTIRALSGNDVIFGAGGNDHLFGGAGKDVVVGGTGGDSLFGGSSADLLNAMDFVEANDLIKGGSGLDNCRPDPGDVLVECP